MQLYREIFSRLNVKLLLLTWSLILFMTSIGDAMRISHNARANAVFFATEGGSISLKCPCDKNATAKNFAWLCPKKEYFSQFSQNLETSHQKIKHPDSRESTRFGRQRIANGTLEIATVCGSDAGIYKCLAESECVDCAICQATVRLEVARLGGDGKNKDIPACAKDPSPSAETLHYSDWTYGALIFSAGLVLGLALAMFIVIFRKRSRKRFGSRRSNISSKDSFLHARSIIERQKADSLRRATHLLQKTRTISHRWMPIREESFQDCQSMMTAFDDAEYGMYVNPLRTRQSNSCNSIPSGPPPLPPRPKSKDSLSGHDTSDYEEADETVLIKNADLEAEEEDNLEDSDGYVKMTIPSRPNSEMPTLGRCSEFHPNSSILKDFAMAMRTPETNVHVSYIELMT